LSFLNKISVKILFFKNKLFNFTDVHFIKAKFQMAWELLVFFFVVAALYASAGFGGGSSYLALLALYGLSMATMRLTALLCNIVVVFGGTYIFYKSGYLNWRKILPLSLASIPMAFLGGYMKLNEKTFFILLGVSLVIAAFLMFFQHYFKNKTPNQLETRNPKSEIQNQLRGGIIGGVIGLLSGMVGIGGGIFLSPILNLMRWDTPKHIAATASFFILVNSISGLIGQALQNPNINWAFVLPLMAAVFAGGQLGSRLSALKLNQLWVRQITAALVLYAGINILWTHI
jgi:hypothetical protein